MQKERPSAQGVSHLKLTLLCGICAVLGATITHGLHRLRELSRVSNVQREYERLYFALTGIGHRLTLYPAEDRGFDTWEGFHAFVTKTVFPRSEAASNPLPALLPGDTTYGRVRALPRGASRATTPLLWGARQSPNGTMLVVLFWDGSVRKVPKGKLAAMLEQLVEGGADVVWGFAPQHPEPSEQER